jgi:hypothetical protein
VFAADQFITVPVDRTEDTVRAHAAGEEARTIIAGPEKNEPDWRHFCSHGCASTPEHLPHLLDAKLLGRSSLSNQNQNDPPSYRTYQNPVVICVITIDRRMLNHCLLKQPMLSRTISIRNRAGNF